jgi:hypothetical protein
MEPCGYGLTNPFAVLPGMLAADCGTYFFKVFCQFSTTVKGTEALCVRGTPMRKLPVCRQTGHYSTQARFSSLLI